MSTANRLERGLNYFAHVQKRAKFHGVTLRHTRVEVHGVAHDADRMFNSVCGKAALFDAPGCELKLGDSFVAATAAVAAIPATATGTVIGTGAASGSTSTRPSQVKP